MTKEELLKELEKLPKIETNNPISAMNSINVDDLMSAVDRLNKIPDYNNLLKENQELKKQLQTKHDGFMASTDELCEYAVENDKLKKQLEDMTDNYCSASKLKHERAIKIVMMNNQQKEFINYLEDEIKLYGNDIQNFKKDYKVYFSLINDLRVSKAKIEEILQKYKEITGG